MELAAAAVLFFLLFPLGCEEEWRFVSRDLHASFANSGTSRHDDFWHFTFTSAMIYTADAIIMIIIIKNPSALDDFPTGNCISTLLVFRTLQAHQYRNRYLASKTTTSTTTTTTTTTPPPPPAISYSQYKWNTYGTRTGVEQSRRQSYHTNGGFNTHQTGRHHHGHHHNGNGHHNNPYGSRSHAQPQTPG